MSPWLLATMFLADAPAIRFERHEIDAFPNGYQVSVADLNGDGRPDVIALSTEANRVDWYENPSWKRRPVARVERPVDLAPYDLDGDGKPEIALASGFYFNDSARGGQIQWLKAKADLDQPWDIHPIAVDPVVHRLRWADLDGSGRKMLVHAPIFGPGSKANVDPKPSHLWAFRVPKDPVRDPWPVVKIDESLTVLHGLCVGRTDSPSRDTLKTASHEGITMFVPEGRGDTLRFDKSNFFKGGGLLGPEPGATPGCSEVAPLGLFGSKDLREGWFEATIEPWHGNKVVAYVKRHLGDPGYVVLDDALSEGHALVVGDFDGDGEDEIVAGWRGAGGGLTLYRWVDELVDGRRTLSWQKFPLDRGIAVEGAVAADLNGDGRLDLVVISGRTNKLVWYENVRGK